MPNTDELNMMLASGMAAFEAKHFSRAAGLLAPLADAGLAEAQYRMGIMTQNGLGRVRSAEAALRWLLAAAQQGHALAQHGVGFIYLEGEDGIPPDAQQALYWFSLAAAQGLAGSAATLGRMYADGLGVKPDPEQAKAWYRKAGFDELA
jgi:TPR repeat protein